MNFQFHSKALGCLSYNDALAVQYKYHKLCLEGVFDAVFLSLEHSPVITLGKHALAKDILCSESSLLENHIEVHRSDRGGKVTCHMPGQLVLYPIVSLTRFGLGVREYVSILEESLLDLLQSYGVQGDINTNNPGVWVSEKKIASIGVRVKERVSLHGLALNIDNKLSLFELVVPCGMERCAMTRLKDQTTLEIDKGKLSAALIQSLIDRFCHSHRVNIGRNHGRNSENSTRKPAIKHSQSLLF